MKRTMTEILLLSLVLFTLIMENTMNEQDVEKIRKQVADEKIKRLAPGKAILGPEHLGCINSGFRPMLARSMMNDRYLVGYELDVRTVRRAMHYPLTAKQVESKNVLREINTARGVEKLHRPVRQYKTRASAIKRFREMCVETMVTNEEQAREMKRLREASAKGDLEAAVSLGLDY